MYGCAALAQRQLPLLRSCPTLVRSFAVSIGKGRFQARSLPRPFLPSSPALTFALLLCAHRRRVSVCMCATPHPPSPSPLTLSVSVLDVPACVKVTVFIVSLRRVFFSMAHGVDSASEAAHGARADVGVGCCYFYNLV